MKPQLQRDGLGRQVLGVDVRASEFARWHATAAQVREVVLARMVTGFSMPEAPPEALIRMPSQNEVEATADMAFEAIVAGRMIDFGDLPNDVMMAGGIRGGSMYEQGALAPPFTDPWVMMHTWADGTSVYLINLLEQESPLGGVTEVCELQPLMFQGNRSLVISDRAILLRPPPGMPVTKYCCEAAPSSWRYLPGAEMVNNGMAPEEAAAGNVLDPFMTAMLILNTRNVVRETIRADEKLNRARVRSRKPPIPPYDRVHAEGYVSALAARARGHSPPQGGTHASPVTHIRMGHWRHYADGRRTLIMDTLVNATPEAREGFKSTRTHYAR